MSFFSKFIQLFSSNCCTQKDEVSQPSESEQYAKILLSELHQIEDEIKNYQFLFGDAITRYQTTSTTPNQRYLSERILDEKTQEVILFTTRGPLSSDAKYDLESRESPLLAAVIKNLNGYILCDGLLLSVARQQRTLEVQIVLNDAEKSNKVNFCSVNVEFTSKMETLKAIVYLLKQAENNKTPFTRENRVQFFAQLSNYTEAELENF